MITALLLAIAQTGQAPASCCDPMSPLAADPAFVAAHESPRPLRFAPKEGKAVTFSTADGKTAGGFFVPASAKKTTAIVMVHEWWGLNDYIKREAERIHDATGYAVLAVDMYGGKVATTPADAGKFMGAVTVGSGTGVVQGAVNSLLGGKFGTKFTKLGTIGWCFGGGWSHRAAIAGGAAVKACVMYYGMPDTDQADLAKLKAPVLMVWAKKDGWINEKVVDGFKTAMATAKKPLTVLPFNEDHGFANPSNPKYGKADADTAMAASLAFFKKNLG